jgi:phosphonate transport system substrate-binding protein
MKIIKGQGIPMVGKIKSNFLHLVIISMMFLIIPSYAWSGSKTKKPEKTYTVGVVPQFDTFKLNKIWKPILKELSKETGIKFILKGSPSIPAFEKEFNSGNFDFAYMNPYHLLLAHKNQGYIPLINDKGRTLHGILVVRQDSSINSVKDLNEKTVAFPAPNALGASLMIRAAFEDQFQIKVIPKYVKTHSSVYMNVVLDETNAGGGVQKTLSQQPQEIKKGLKVLYRTKEVSPHPFTAHPRVPTTVRKKVANAFMAIDTRTKGKTLLKKVPFKKVGPSTLKDYDSLKPLKLGRFFVSN